MSAATHCNKDIPIFSVSDLTMRIAGDASDIVERLSFDVFPGKTLCIVGESGCGKSITALGLMGLLPPQEVAVRSGTIRFEGKEYLAAEAHQARHLRGDRLAMIFQEPMTSLNPSYKIGVQIAEAVTCHHSGSYVDAKKQALAMLAKVGIPGPELRYDEYPHQLSGGMRQRVMIAMALINNPAVLIADEPTTALDVTIQAQIIELICELQKNTQMGTIMITHDLGVVAKLATDVAVMYGGQIVESGPVASIFNAPQHPYTIGLLSSMPNLSGYKERLFTIPGTVPNVQSMPKGCRFSSRCPFCSSVCKTQPEVRVVDDAHSVACHFAPLDQTLELSA
ncbi:Oligopeptide transport ATP-binding protein OppD [Pseudovibrio axinellae]|uniref:Oligopeptide transport ATP-binding protein OppD n=1 Tax=Pseudovibrio axinellae TaxID=989403 RepID=A0A165T3U6_9HYPH|nr:ABC transporter ATP-binding protein [Pseudovibrio axinellae]KZL05395.1 Oligopeptide transport ATP-binding protein OppD [Pseudovibrio axinellae]SEQ01087.1 peptide/nickel transport system ATP-binding protein [Pseudovibrio axinellae]